MKHLDPSTMKIPQLANLLTGAIGPRPIALASTLDSDGNPNLSPFSFFNAFGTNPPILVFSPARRGRDNTTKHTFENLKQVPEVVINVVNYSMVHQISLASSDFARGVNEFSKAGFTMEPSVSVTPHRVKESPVQFECRVLQIIETGQEAAAGNLVICQIVAIHIAESILDSTGQIDPLKIDLVGRLGGDFYCRTTGDALFKVEKPLTQPGIGVDALPFHVQNSTILTGNDLGKLGNLKSLPDKDELEAARKTLGAEVDANQDSPEEELREAYHKLARKKIESGLVDEALRILLLSP